jgi:UDP-2,3-diacylglucosamine hydrolase
VSAAAVPIGLLAGAGRFPVVFAEKARRLGHRVCCVGLKHLAPDELRALCSEYHAVGIGKMGRVIRTFRRAGVERIVMAGKVHKAALLSAGRIWELMPDWRAIRFWFWRRRRDNRDDSLLLAVIDEFGRDGLQFASALDYCPEILVKSGVLTRRRPTRGETDDIRFGWELAKEMGRLDVGQSVAVRERAVLAVEAIEGTDRAIGRAGELAGGAPFVVVKVAKPNQDPRFDVPTVGTSTVETMRRAGGSVLAVEAGRTIILDEHATVALADQYGLTIVALETPPAG